MRTLSILAACLLFLCPSAQALTLQPEDFIVNPEALGSGVDSADNKMELYTGGDWPPGRAVGMGRTGRWRRK